MSNHNPIHINQPSVMDFFKRIPDEQAAREYLESARWPNGVTCIHCGHNEVWKIRQGKLYTCKECRKQFTVRTGTVMEDSKIPLQQWIYAMYLVSNPIAEARGFCPCTRRLPSTDVPRP